MEDLIIHKLIFYRPRDIEDLKAIILKQKNNLDEEYIKKWLKIFSKTLEIDLIERFETLKNTLKIAKK